MTHPLIRRVSLLPALFALLGNGAFAEGKKPNIVFILADDLGYTDVSAYGSKYYETPNIDRLAKEGVKFTSGYTAGPNCQPTRAALLSGQYGPRTGVYTVGNIDRFNWQSRPLRPVDNLASLPLEKTTIAQSLKKAGYATALFGKWHLGESGEAHPSKRGFDEAIVASGKHFNFKTSPETAYPKGTYLADFLTDKAVDFIERHKDGPFFLYLPHYGVHSPLQAKPELVAKFKDKAASGGHKDPVYAAMIASVDESVGRIAAKLDELGLSENTLIVFTSDNGGVGGYQREGIQAKDTTDNAPLRGGKGTLHEGGIRVPYVFRWKGVIPAGSVSETPIISVDLHPSLLELSGAPAPENQPLDGVSYVASLKDPSSTLKRDALFWHFPGYLGSGNDTWRTKPVSVVREGNLKLVENLEDRSLELYDLSSDLSEKNNLATAQPEKAASLLAKLNDWRKDVGAKFPTKNDPSEPAKAGKKGKKKKKSAADDE
ncbi:sulfatase [Luteolibacter sp. SL250]|uniref:sulfatase n=1 Tax=Luteolibacter sp. SL250 TaxID=2995170 RepID=UPI002270844C|nr:sulfatase [Luteolibacter sp. SL250]WAC20489.1 sulfatase [Luteolibacter sp. SL250]